MRNLLLKLKENLWLVVVALSMILVVLGLKIMDYIENRKYIDVNKSESEEQGFEGAVYDE